ncbi:MAG: iron-sulfur cluster assembly accessory protein, partial [Nanoarchaeota archaeon]|nr:iron-sulfur cluster assembly accessory protein [Nanoarchaeota archaeon]
KEFSGKITKDMTIGDIVEASPKAAEILTSYGIHCVGCHASPFETLEQGLQGHGISQEEVDKIVSEINEKLSSHSESKEELIISDEAAEKIKELIAKKEDADGLRVNVSPGGCSGFEYEFKLENTKEDSDSIIEQKGVKLYVSKETMDLIKGSEINYVDSLQGAGFSVKNPNATSTCGCGSSFS